MTNEINVCLHAPKARRINEVALRTRDAGVEPKDVALVIARALRRADVVEAHDRLVDRVGHSLDRVQVGEAGGRGEAPRRRARQSASADARVDVAVREVREKAADEDGQTDRHSGALNHRVVLADHGVQREAAEPRPREHRLDDD